MQQLSLQSLLTTLGYSSFRGDQERIIGDAISGKNTFVLMPTGMGKSLCYQAPALLKEGLVVVVSPLLALMKDQGDKAQKLGIKAGDIHSLLSQQERRSSLEQGSRFNFQN